MATEIIMPKNGMDMQEGVIVRWLKNVGERVALDEPIMEIETDKITMESEAPAPGVLLCKYFDEGDTVPVLTVLGYIGAEGEQVPAAPGAVGSAQAFTPAQEVSDAQAARTPVQAEESERYDYDVAVIGGGPAGYVGAIRAAQLGGRVILFEKAELGGTCLNRGCIPTKAYLKTAELLHAVRNAGERGVLVGDAAVDMAKVVSHKDGVVRTLTTGVAGLLRSHEIEVVKGEAALTGLHTIGCAGKTYSARSILLCGGAKAGAIPLAGIEHEGVLTSDSLLALKTLPKRLCIIGGGVIGCELACAFRAFGSEVTIIELLDRLVASMDASVSAEIRKALSAQGISIHTGTSVECIGDEGGKPVVVTKTMRIPCDNVLVSIGRSPDLSCLGVLAGEIKTERGRVVVDDQMRTSVAHIYAPGDMNGRLMLAHAAFAMAEAAASCAMGRDRSAELRYTPSCLYTIPEAASVGLTEAEARTQYDEDRIAVGSFPMAANGRALASGEKTGFVRVIIDKRYGELLGVHIVASGAAEMIAEPAALMRMEITAHEVTEDIIHGHPTFAEAFMEACADALGRCIHLPRK